MSLSQVRSVKKFPFPDFLSRPHALQGNQFDSALEQCKINNNGILKLIGETFLVLDFVNNKGFINNDPILQMRK